MSKKIINSPYFDLSVQVDENSADMAMRLKTPFQTTKNIPHIYEVLNTYLPEVLNTKCFNRENLPFHEKVKNTNLAHLFEHILLAYMIEERKKYSDDETYFRGLTEWDWRAGKDPEGTYRIHVNVKQEDNHLFEEALQKATELVEALLHSVEPNYLLQ